MFWPGWADRALIVFFDADTLLNLAQNATALRAVTQAIGSDCRVTDAVVDELTASVKHHPPVPNAARALGAARDMERVNVMEMDPGVQDTAARLRDSVASPSDPATKHLGEATSVACAAASGGLVASDDSDTRVMARQSGLAVVTTIDLLKKMADTQRMSDQEVADAVDSMETAGRSVDTSGLGR